VKMGKVSDRNLFLFVYIPVREGGMIATSQFNPISIHFSREQGRRTKHLQPSTRKTIQVLLDPLKHTSYMNHRPSSSSKLAQGK